MDDVPVTIIVKAPNQQFEDQTIKCEISWTIERLKSYLSEVYPNKPKSDEQKLIYSGKLLRDSAVLKDVLRQYDGQDTHTVHLVFTPKNQRFEPSNGSGGSNSSSSMPTAGSTSAAAAAQSSANELRHRASATAPGTNTSEQQQPLLFGNPNGVAPLAQLQQHMLLAQQYAMHNTVQHIYAQYMQQYMSGVSPPPPQNQSTSASAVPYTSLLAQQQSQLHQQQFIYQAALMQQQMWNAAGLLPQQQQQQQQGLIGQQQQPNNNAEANAAAALVAAADPADDNDENNNDWYRTTMVWQHRHQQLLNMNNRLDAVAAQLDAVDGAAAAPAAPADVVAPAGAGAGEAGADPSNAVVGQEPNNQRMPVIALIRTFVLSFFASLIPETPHL